VRPQSGDAPFARDLSYTLGVADKPFQGAHHFLLGALKVAPPETHPPEPFHRGGPALKIDAEAYVVGALWLADRIKRFVEPRDRKEFDDWVGLARKQLELGTDNNTNQKKIYAADASKVSRIPAKVGCWAAHEAGNWAWRSIYAGGAARPSAANVARFFAKKAPEELPKYLKDLDAQCLILDAQTSLRDKKLTIKSKVAEVLWRGHEGGKVLYWLMRLANKKLALLYKEKTRWRLTEGERDDVLSTVAESHFEEAVNAVVRS
jgi:hypothetical protein